jgi:hypothetical protein
MDERLMDMEPEPAAPANVTGPAEDPFREALAAMLPSEPVRLALSLPPGFNLPALLQFLPDIRLKAAADAAAAEALAVTVSGADGVARGDVALGRARAATSSIERCFKDPVALAYELHKRLTGLRGDFVRAAEAAIRTVGQRVYDETRRLEQVAAEAQRVAQAQADEEQRKATAAAAKQAKAAGAPAAYVKEMREHAKVATAPPVASPAPAPVLTGSVMAQSWKARLAGSPADDPQPEMEDLTAEQQAAVRAIFGRIADGTLPLLVGAINWPYVNRRAGADKQTFALPGFEAYDAGSLRGKGRR